MQTEAHKCSWERHTQVSLKFGYTQQGWWGSKGKAEDQNQPISADPSLDLKTACKHVYGPMQCNCYMNTKFLKSGVRGPGAVA